MTTIDVTRTEEWATVTIANPERRNAIDAAACERMAGVLRELAGDDDVRVVHVTGAGEHFCSGIDLAEGIGSDGVEAELERGLHAIVAALVRMAKPTVASVRGGAVGAGAAVATACDFVYADATAEFAWTFTDIGLAPDSGATWVLPRLVGYRRAMELLVTGRRVDAEEAREVGIATAVVSGDLDATVREHLETLAGRPTLAVGATKRLLARNTHRSLEEALRAEARTQARMVRTDDFAEGVTAFFGNRQPEFTGE